MNACRRMKPTIRKDDDVCKDCEPGHDPEECRCMTKCPICGHAHNDRGCTDCDCPICPACKHVHRVHKGHDEHRKAKGGH